MSASNRPEKDKNTETREPSTGEGGLESKSRRRLAKAGLTTPVIVTLFSRPVWGEPICGSITGSKIESKGVDCFIGCSPAFWCKKSDLWSLATGGAVNQNTLFKDIFMCNSEPFGDSTLEEVICAIFGVEPKLNPGLIQACIVQRGGKNAERFCKGALQKLGYHAAASYLTAKATEFGPNNLPPLVVFPIPSDEVISRTCAALDSSNPQDWITQEEEFEIYNEAGCEVLEKELGLDPFGDR